ncbi:UNVERIFIED_ORG: hypothetical protein J2Y94_001386 [Pseudomonas poae]
MSQVIGEQAGVKFIGMVAMNERTLGSAAGVSNLLFGVYNTGVALLGEKLRIRYRYDSTAFIPEWANAAFKYIQTHYSTNERYIAPVSLEPGDILVMDNLRVLHARHKFIDGNQQRKVGRLWIADDASTTFKNILDQSPVRRAMLPFQNYNIAQSETAGHSFIEYTCGIRAQSSTSLPNAHKQFDSALEAL